MALRLWSLVGAALRILDILAWESQNPAFLTGLTPQFPSSIPRGPQVMERSPCVSEPWR